MKKSHMDLLIGIALIVVAGLAVAFLSGSTGAFIAIIGAVAGAVFIIKAMQANDDAPHPPAGQPDPLELNNSGPAQEASGSGLGAGLAGEYDWDAHYQREFGQQGGKPDDTQGGSSQYR